jgi:hypothetical protein
MSQYGSCFDGSIGVLFPVGYVDGVNVAFASAVLVMLTSESTRASSIAVNAAAVGDIVCEVAIVVITDNLPSFWEFNLSIIYIL